MDQYLLLFVREMLLMIRVYFFYRLHLFLGLCFGMNTDF